MLNREVFVVVVVIETSYAKRKEKICRLKKTVEFMNEKCVEESPYSRTLFRYILSGASKNGTINITSFCETS